MTEHRRQPAGRATAAVFAAVCIVGMVCQLARAALPRRRAQDMLKPEGACTAGYYCIDPECVDCALCRPGEFMEQPVHTEMRCHMCPAGQMSEAFGATACDPCVGGYFQSRQAQATCEACPAGQFSRDGATACTFCDKGQYSTTASSSCKQCAAGQYADEAGLPSCKLCSAGRFTSSAGSASAASCGACPAGKFSAEAGSVACSSCAAGKYSAEGSVSCSSCPAGQYSGSTNAESCTACAPGTYQSAAASSSCNSCPAGTFSGGSATSCTACPAGTYSDAPSQSSCKSCPTGTWAAASGSDAAGDCVGCGAGKYLTSSRTCAACPAGTFSNSATATSCTACPAGTYQTATGTSSCISCPAGKYQGNTGQAANTCADCRPGYFSTSGATTCQACPSGKYQSLSGQGTCVNCPAGRYGSGQGLSACTACAANTYSAAVGATDASTCLSCPSGETSTAGSSSCGACPAGSYPGSGGACTNCPAGQYSASGSSCSACPVGKFSEIAGRASCASCPAGTTSSADMTSCTACAAGQYSSSAGSTCSKCPAGKYTNLSGQTACTDCAAGKYQSSEGMFFCVSCPVGRYNTVAGSTTECTLCPAGQYQHRTAKTFCRVCPAGLQYDLSTRKTCYYCPAGRVNPTPGGLCVNCPAGQFTTEYGKSTCTSCPAGTYSGVVASNSADNCLSCAAGTFSSAGSSSCANCPLGKFSSSAGSGTCSTCGAGRYADAAASTTCKACAGGTAHSLSGQTSSSACVACTAGQYAPSSGSSTCTECPAGQYQASSGSLTCGACPAGKFRATAGGTSAADCVSCESNYYSGEGAAACTACPTGRVSPPGSSSCLISCSAGQYLADTYTCASCGPGTYYSASGHRSTSCIDCPAGQYQDGSGAASCKDCLAGTYTSQAGYGSCTACAAGKYNSVASSTGCDSCPAGRVSTAAGASTCTTCPAGKYAAAGSSVCTSCPAGRFGGAAGLTSAAACTVCPAGEFSSSAGSTSCSSCPAGKYSSSAGSSSCATCPAGRYGQGGSSSSDCSGVCTAGYYCPAGSTSSTATPCGNVGKYCPAGSQLPTTAVAGFYTHGSGGASDVSVSSESTRVGQSKCPKGSYCTGGRRINCPAGTYGAVEGLPSSSCSGQCTAGYFCAAGSTSPTAATCGSAAFYCPAGTTERKTVSDGYYSTPVTADEALRTGQEECEAGKVCSGGSLLKAVSFSSAVCPAGRTTRSILESKSGNVGSPVVATVDDSYTGGAVTYSIVGSSVSKAPSSCSTANPFVISTTTGQLNVTGSGVDREDCTSFNLTVRATVDGGETADCKVAVTITDVNESPSISGCGGGYIDLSISEGSPVGTEVGSAIAATDPDQGQTLLFTFPTNTKPFSIGACDGQVKVKRDELDFQTTSSYSLTVRVQDDGVPQLTDECTVRITVLNKNDAPTLAGATFTADENIAAGTVVGTAQASDKDGLTGLQYSIHRQDSPSLWAINAATGAISLAAGKSLDFESKVSHSIGVQVQDPDGAKATADFTINVKDVQEAPVISGGPAAGSTLNVAENAPAGTAIGSPLVASDDDAGHASAIGWSLQQQADFFSISSSGQLSLAKSGPDYEGQYRSQTITVTARDPSGLAAVRSLTIAVTDVNEQPAMNAASIALSRSVAEDATDGTNVGAAVVASDPDSSQQLRYAIVSGNEGGAFKIVSGSGQLQVANPTSIDYETRSSYTLQIQACDSASPSLCTDANDGTVVVNVTDTTEAPQMENPQARSVPENSAAGTAVGAPLSVTDPDDGDKVTCSIVGGNANAAFEMAPNSCQLRVKTSSALDHESRPTFTLKVKATDDSADARSTEATVTVDVTNVNEKPLINDNEDSRAVPELASAGWKVGPPVAGEDKDAGDSISWSLQQTTGTGAAVEGMLALFTIDAASGQLKTKTAIPSDMTPTTRFIDAVATDNSGLSTSLTLTIEFSASNSPPTFSATAFSVKEDKAIGSWVGSVAGQASDPDSHPLKFSITAGNEKGLFAIDGGSGNLTLAGRLDFETSTTHSLQVTATDIPGTMDGVVQPALSATATVTVSVGDVNEPPVFPASTTSSTVQLDENPASGTLVTTVQASDPDAGDTASLSYSITSGDASRAFSIDSSSGAITVAKPSAINYEVTSEFALDVRATDGEGAYGSARVTVSVQDKNDPPVLTVPPTATVSENTATGTVVGTLSASDQDEETVKFSITAGNSAGVFALDASTGSLTLAQAPNFESGSSYTLTVSASDVRGASDTGSWTINILNVEENPTYTGVASFSVAENTAIGTTVATLTAADEDAGDAAALRFSLVAPDADTGSGSSDAPFFTIGASSGIVKVARSLNHEENSSIKIRVVVTDSKGLTASKDIAVTVTNVDELPVFSTSSLTVPETANAGSVIGTIHASDPDAGQTVSYSIISGTSYVTIDGDTGVVRVSALAGSDVFDFEGADGKVKSFSLTVRATSSPGYVDKSVTVTVTDKNEAPVLEDASRTIPENSPINTPVGDPLEASDEDAGQSLAFAILTGNEDGYFKIDRCSGQIKVASSAGLDFESKSSFSLTVQVTDDGPSSPGPAALSDTATITITLTNVNEPPQVRDSTRTVDENSPSGSVVGAAVVVADEDDGDSHVLAISGGNEGGALKIDPSSGVISVQTPSALDHETTSMLRLNITATDKGGLTGWGIVSVQIADVNEAPQLNVTSAAASPSVAENSAAGSAVGAPLPGTDQDEGDTITYSIVGGTHAGLFSIDASSGQLRVASGADLDFETSPSLALIVSLNDGTLSTQAPVTVKLTNVNERPVLPSTATLKINEGAGAAEQPTPTGGTTMLPKAADPDSGDVVTYTLESQSIAGAFRVLPSSGVIEVLTPSKINFEDRTSHSLVLRATDQGALRSECTVTIQVVDVNEAPILRAGQTRSVNENTPGTVLGSPLEATDVDSGDSLTFSIRSVGDSYSQFAIDSTTGLLSTSASASLNHEASEQVTLSIRVTDSGGLYDEKAVTVSVNDINEAPVMSATSYSFKVQENAKNGQEVGRLSATDVDAGDSLTFSGDITNAADGQGSTSDFAVDPATGRVLVAAATPASVSEYLPRGKDYTLVATVRDSAGLAQSVPVTITVEDVNDPPVLVAAASVSLSVSELADAGSSVGQVSATDPDGDAVSFRLLNQADKLQIEAATGKISVIEGAALDFETRSSFAVTVAASDGKLEVTEDYTVSITDGPEAPAFIASSLIMSVVENPGSIGTVVGRVQSSDPDAADKPSGVLKYSVTDSGAAGHFALNSTTGAVTVASLDIDRETQSSYSIGVRVTDSAGLSGVGTLTITVVDRNDRPRLGDTSQQLAELTSVGSIVLPGLPAQDEDPSHVISYAMGRAPCWAATPSAARVAHYAPVAADGPLTMTAILVGPGDNPRKRTSTARILLRAGPQSEDSTSVDESTPANRYEIVLPAPNGGGVRLLRCPSTSGSCATVATTQADIGSTAALAVSIDENTGAITILTSKDPASTSVSGSGSSFSLPSDSAASIVFTDPDVFRARRVGFSVDSVSATQPTRITRVCFNHAAIGTATPLHFGVAPSSGIVTTKEKLNFEAIQWYGIEVVARDDNGGGDASGQLSSAGGVVQVHVTDSNEDPVWSTSVCGGGGDPEKYAACLQIDEGSSAPQDLGSVAAAVSDPDSLAQQTLRFSIDAKGNTDTNGNLVFEIDEQTGVIRFASAGAIDHESRDSWVLVVTAEDDGSPKLSASTKVKVTVRDVNESPAILAARRTIPELSAAGTVVVGGPLVASDPDAASTADPSWGQVQFAITGGTGASFFAVDAATGLLTVTSVGAAEGALDFESPGSDKFTLTVRVTDGGGLTATTEVSVEVTDVNERPTVSATSRNIAEDASPRSPAGVEIPSDDPDNHHPVHGAVQQLQYSIVGGSGSGLFSIDACSGQLMLLPSAALDYETDDLYEVVVKVADDAEQSLAATATVTVNILDSNDAPVITAVPGGYQFAIAENSPVGALLTSAPGAGGGPYDRLAATDADVNAMERALWANQTWSIASGNELGIFRVHPSTGVLSLAAGGRLDFEDNNANAFALVVQVCDSGSPSLCDTAPVSVKVLNVNEAPTFNQASLRAVRSVKEATDASSGSTQRPQQGDVLGEDIVAEDPDGEAASAQLSFAIESVTPESGAGLFSIDSSATPRGKLVLRKAAETDLDFESVSSYTITVTVEDAGGLSATGTMVVAVEDVNEAPSLRDSSFSIPENSPVLTPVGDPSSLVQAVDVDGGEAFKYTIMSQTISGAFQIAEATAALSVAKASALDFETTPTHTLQVRVTDRGGLQDSAEWVVHVRDVQEPPTALDLAVQVSEMADPGAQIGAVFASDPDAADQADGALTFSIVEQPVGANGRAAFEIDTSSGAISVGGPFGAASPGSGELAAATALDFENRTVHSLRVQVQDSAGNTDDCTVTVKVRNENEPPVLSGATLFVPASSSADLVYLNPAYVVDPDAGDSHTFSLVAGNSADGALAIDARTGRVYVSNNESTSLRYVEGTSLDTAALSIVVQVTDQGGLTGTAEYPVFVTDANQAPRFVSGLPSSGSSYVVAENSPESTLVATVVAADHNADQELTYSIQPRGKNINRPFPFAVRTVGSSSAQNDAQNKAEIVIVRTDPTTGDQLSVDFEGAFATYDAVLTATDNHPTLPLSVSQDISIRLQDVPEAPMFSLPVGTQVNEPIRVSLSELAESGASLGGNSPLRASDVDQASTGKLRFSIVRGSGSPVGSEELFSVDGVSGELSFVGPGSAIDFEDPSRNSFTFTARVEDEEGLADEHTVVVSIEDENEAPTLTKSTFEFTISENPEPGTVVGETGATDPDTEGSLFSSLQWTLSSPGTPSEALENAFTIDSQGTIRVAEGADLDWENRASYELVVRVEDGAPPSDRLFAEGAVSITLTDVDDLQIASIHALDESTIAELAWNLPASGGSLSLPGSWPPIANPTSMRILFATRGGAKVRIAGRNIGRTAESLARDGVADPDAAASVMVTYGPVDGTKYTARSCHITVAGSEIECSVPEGVGLQHVWKVSLTPSPGTRGSDTAISSSTMSEFKTGYAPPTLSGAESVSSGSGLFQTSGGELLRLIGDNLGPLAYQPLATSLPPVATDVSVVYESLGNPDGARDRYAASGCVVETPHVAVLCNTSEGIGASLAFELSVGGQTSNKMLTSLAYQAPVILSVQQMSLATEGGEDIVLVGENFGPAGTADPAVQAQYHSSFAPPSGGIGVAVSTSNAFQASRCRVSDERPHRELRCTTAAGVGAAHVWMVTVGGQQSPASSITAPPSAATSSYIAPRIFRISGQGADMADTKGGQKVIIDGENFGPEAGLASTAFPVSAFYGPPPASVDGGDLAGPASDWWRFAAVDCRVVTAHRQIECDTSEGTGKGHVWEVEVAGQRSGILVNRTTSYHPPVVAYYSGQGSRDADTRGGEEVLIEGRNFGPQGTAIERVVYSRVGSDGNSEADTAVFTANNCSIVEAHTRLRCISALGAGAQLSWSVRIDGQDSVSPTTNYHAPAISSFTGEGAEDASTGGGDVVVLQGDFLATQQHLGAVTYGPTGREFTAKNCQIAALHTEITCETVPGTGRKLRWQVSVGDQASPLSSSFTSYAAPVITAVESKQGFPTTGADVNDEPVIVRIKGFNFGAEYELARLVVRFNARGLIRPTGLVGGNNGEPFTAYRAAVLSGQDAATAASETDDSSAAYQWLLSLDTPLVEAFGVLDQETGLSFADVSLPEGFGQERELVVEVDGVPSALSTVSYNKPKITNVAPDRQDVEPGLLRVFVDGEDFCSGKGGCGKILINGEAVDPEFYTHTQILVIIPDPAASEVDQMAVVEVGGVQSEPFNFRRPVPSFSGAEQGIDWGEMDGTGGEDLQLLHISDIRSVPAEDIVVWIGPYNVTGIQKFRDEDDEAMGTDSIRFKSPPGVGANHEVLLEVTNGARSRAGELTFSYRPPEISDIRLDGRDSSVVDAIVASSSRRRRLAASELAGNASAAVPALAGPERDASGVPTLGADIEVLGSGFGHPSLVGEARVVLDGITEIPIVLREPGRIVARVPPGDGAGHDLRLIVGGQTSRTFSSVALRYASPTVADSRPCDPLTGAPTAGGIPVCVSGFDFGIRTPVVLIDGRECTMPETLNHTLIQCTLPDGDGADLPVTVAVAGQGSSIPPEGSSARFTYNEPQVLGLTPMSGPTSGRAPPKFNDIMSAVVAEGEAHVMTLVGSDFGRRTPTILFRPGPSMLGQSEAIQVEPTNILERNHTHVRFLMPEGFGLERRVHIIAGGQESTSAAPFMYDPPRLDTFMRGDKVPGACSPQLACVVPPEQFARNSTCKESPALCEVCSYVPAGCWETRGQYPLRIIGESFGRSDDADVSVGGRPCQQTAEQRGRRTHNMIECTVPRGFGENLPVVVSVGSRSTSVTEDSLFSYDPPIVQQVVPNRPSASGARIQILGKNFGWEETPVAVSIGGLPCSQAEWLNDGTLECDAPSGVAGLKNVTVRAANRSEPVLVSQDSGVVAYQCEFGSYGVYGETCLECDVHANGAVCEGGEDFFDLVVAKEGWWRFNVSTDHDDCHVDRRQTRTPLVDPMSGQATEWCPSFKPCEPTWACVGDNVCALGYEGDRCSSCSEGFYRYGGECARCPDSPWLLVGAFVAAAIVACVLGYFLSAKQVNIAFVSIGIDYFQVLALFSRARVRWPAILLDLFKFMSAFNLNLELAAPECALPEITYGQKWFFSMGIPIALAVVLSGLYAFGYIWRCCCRRKPASERHEHSHKLISIGVISLYVMYVYLTRLTLDVFNCAPTDPPDGKQYMSGMTDVVCYESALHKTLIPFGIGSFAVYVVALPALALLLLYRNKTTVKHDQLCRALSGSDERYSERRYITEAVWKFRQRWNRLYYLFKPGKWYWIIIILVRKFLIAFSSLMFRNTPSYQLAFALLIMFSAYVIQVKNNPYMSPGDYEGELQKHVVLAEMPGKEGRVHKRIRDIMEAVERQNANDKGRGAARGAWRTAAKRMYVVKAAKKGVSEEDANLLAMFLVDYNAVESVLLACGVLVCLSGIMFLSARFNGELATYYQSEYDGLAIAVAVVICASIAYFCIVLAFEIFYLLDKKRAAKLVGACSRHARKMAARSRQGKAKAIAVAGGSMGKMGGSDDGAAMSSSTGRSEIGLEQNALMLEESQEGGLDDVIQFVGLASMDHPPDEANWRLFRREHARLISQVRELSEMLRTQQPSATAASRTEGFMSRGAIARRRRDISSRLRQFNPVRVANTDADGAGTEAVASLLSPVKASSIGSDQPRRKQFGVNVTGGGGSSINPMFARGMAGRKNAQILRRLNRSRRGRLRKSGEGGSARNVPTDEGGSDADEAQEEGQLGAGPPETDVAMDRAEPAGGGDQV